MLSHLSLFSGIGGIDLAAEWAGFETKAFCEQNQFCQQVLGKHWPGVPIYDDVRTLTRQSLVERGIDPDGIDLLSGGDPCQPFSSEGEQMGLEDDRYLWPESFRLIKELRPSWVLRENVIGSINMVLDIVLSNLESEGYTARAFVLPACAVGAQHRRDRVFVVAHSPGLGLQRRSFNRPGQRIKTLPEKTAWRAISPPFVIGKNDGLSRGVAKPLTHALGNAVVPQQVYPILKAIAESYDNNEAKNG